MKTYMAKAGKVDQKWLLIDATDRIVGRLATKVATVLMGKHRPTYTPHVDTGDFVVIVNAAAVKTTGANKGDQRLYENFSGYPSGRKTVTMAAMMQSHPERVITEAVRRMLPKTRLGRAMIKKLKVYAGAEHPHQAQQPDKIEL